MKKMRFGLFFIGGIILIGGFLFVLYSCANTSKNSHSQNTNNSGNSAAELTFNFTRLSGYSSNQFAVWIEDPNGQYIKTIYATRFTANGGWKRRETSLPLWVKQSIISEKNKTQTDALTSATPKTGNLTYIWDGSNDMGVPVSDGNYIIILEGTLRQENQVYYRAPIRLGQGVAVPEVSIEYIGDAGADRGMINDVIVQVLR